MRRERGDRDGHPEGKTNSKSIRTVRSASVSGLPTEITHRRKQAEGLSLTGD